MVTVQAFSDLHTTTAHCDLKPDNIMVDIEESGFVRLKVVDWASSCSVSGGQQLKHMMPIYLPTTHSCISALVITIIIIIQRFLVR